MARVWLRYAAVPARCGQTVWARRTQETAILPGDGDAGVRVVRAQRSGSHRRREVPARAMPLGHLAQRGLSPSGRHPGALDVRPGLALSAASPPLGEWRRMKSVSPDSLDRARSLNAAPRQRILQVMQAILVGHDGSAIEHVAESSDLGQPSTDPATGRRLLPRRHRDDFKRSRGLSGPRARGLVCPAYSESGGSDARTGARSPRCARLTDVPGLNWSGRGAALGGLVFLADGLGGRLYELLRHMPRGRVVGFGALASAALTSPGSLATTLSRWGTGAHSRNRWPESAAGGQAVRRPHPACLRCQSSLVVSGDVDLAVKLLNRRYRRPGIGHDGLAEKLSVHGGTLVFRRAPRSPAPSGAAGTFPWRALWTIPTRAILRPGHRGCIPGRLLGNPGRELLARNRLGMPARQEGGAGAGSVDGCPRSDDSGDVLDGRTIVATRIAC